MNLHINEIFYGGSIFFFFLFIFSGTFIEPTDKYLICEKMKKEEEEEKITVAIVFVSCNNQNFLKNETYINRIVVINENNAEYME